jgi:archaemetzincin
MVRTGPAWLALVLAAGCGRAPSLSSPPSDPDFPAKAPEKPGDWLASVPEKGQTLAEYMEECVNRRTDDRKEIVIQPLGDGIAGRAALLDRVREYAAIYFGTEVRVEPALPVPKGTWDARRGQCDGDAILRFLENRLPGKALAFVGLCEEDLWSGDLNFVFGVATLRRRTGVYSLARYGGDGEAAFLRRTLKVLAHETGHILGMEHCVRWECVMNGSNSLAETDRAPAFPCPECHGKLRWNTGFDPARRWAALAAFLDGAGLAAEAAFARRQAAKPPTDPPVPTAR